MVDEKRDRSDAGLQGSGSRYLCTLCDADRDSAIKNLGDFEINRSVIKNFKLYNYIRVNPDKLSELELQRMAKGVKTEPITFIDAIKKGIDATHADINIGSLTDDIKSIVKDAACRFDFFMKEHCGINPQLMMPGNYARTLFETSHDILLKLISDVERRQNLSVILDKF